MYSKAQRRKILDELYPQLEQGEGVNTVCFANEHFPAPSMIDIWVKKLGEEEIKRYACAREAGVHYLVEKMQQIADKCKPESGHVAKARLQSDNIKWSASKLIPHVYGDKTTTQIDGSITLNIIGSDQKTIDNAG